MEAGSGLKPIFSLLFTFCLCLACFFLGTFFQQKSSAFILSSSAAGVVVPDDAPSQVALVEPYSLRSHNSPVRVALLGDSITLCIYCGSDGGYQRLVQESLGAASYSVRAFAAIGLFMTRTNPLTGQPFLDALPTSYFNTDLWIAAQAFSADVYIIMMGANDVLSPWYNESAFMTSYIEMVETLRVLPQVPLVVICAPPPLIYPPEVLVISAAALRLPLTTAAISTAVQAPLIDVYGAFGGEKIERDMTCDSLHLTKKGTALLARAVSDALKQFLLPNGWPAFALE